MYQELCGEAVQVRNTASTTIITNIIVTMIMVIVVTIIVTIIIILMILISGELLRTERLKKGPVSQF